jgi:hypothetical protein
VIDSKARICCQSRILRTFQQSWEPTLATTAGKPERIVVIAVYLHARKTVDRVDEGKSVSCNQEALAKYPYVHSQFALNHHCFRNPFIQADLLMLQEWKRTWLLIQTLCARPDIQVQFPRLLCASIHMSPEMASAVDVFLSGTP